MGHLSAARPCGAWPSPILPGHLARAAALPAQLAFTGGRLSWVERRPAEGGRATICTFAPGEGVVERLPAPASAATRAMTYGGRALAGDGRRWWFSLDAPSDQGDPHDQRLFALDEGGALRALTPRRRWRFAEPLADPARDRLVFTWEDHERPDPRGLPTLCIGALPRAGGLPEVLAGGRDFTCSPRLSPDGRWLAWLAWDHPAMPWDGAELWLAALDGRGRPQAARRVAGGPHESVLQPRFTPRGRLLFLSDRAGAWRLHALDGDEVVPLPGPEGEQGVPPWRVGPSTWDLLGERAWVVASVQEGLWRLWRVAASGEQTPLTPPLGALGEVCAAPDGAVARVEAGEDHAHRLVLRARDGQERTLRDAAAPEQAEWQALISRPEGLVLPTEGGLAVRAWLYPPRLPGFTPLPGERPPLIVQVHGGPHAAASRALDLRVQQWTSRGFAVLDVDHRGSTGYGRAHRMALYGRWGEADVEDVAAAVAAVVARGLADGARVGARGASAGGFTALNLACDTRLLAAVSAWYAVCDLFSIREISNPIEFSYPDRLIAPLPGAEALHRARSPAHKAGRVACPVLLLQGEDDPGVPPAQARAMLAALEAAGVPTRARFFEGEGHGFVREETLRAAHALEQAFFMEALGPGPRRGRGRGPRPPPR